MKACSVCGLLSLLVIHGEPPALLPLLEPTVIYTGKCNSTGNLTRSWSTTNCVIAECQIKPAIISAKLSPICQSDRLIMCPSSVVLLPFVHLYGVQTKAGYWHRAGHKHYACSPNPEARHWPFFTLLRECMCLSIPPLNQPRSNTLVLYFLYVNWMLATHRELDQERRCNKDHFKKQLCISDPFELFGLVPDLLSI